MDPILEVAGRANLQVVEDCAQAPGARYRGRRAGSFGDFGCFSFHTHKNMTTLGEGGMLTVKDPQKGQAARRLRWMGNWPFDGERPRYWEPAMGNIVEPISGRWPYNFCMGEPNCAVGRLLLRRLDDINRRRGEQATRFKEAFSDFPELVFQKVPPSCEPIYHLMCAEYRGRPYGKHRDQLIELLHRQFRLKCLVHYWPLNRTELFQRFGFGDAKVPETDRFFGNMLGFPWWSDMGDELIEDMADRTRRTLTELRSKP